MRSSVAESVSRNRPASRRKLLVFRLVSLALGVVVALIIMEVALRAAGWPSPGLYVQGVGPISLRNPGRAGGAFPPGIRGELRHYDYSVDWVVNSYGFRDSEITSKPDGEWRVGIVGDSFTAGVGVQQRDRFSDVFRAGLQRNHPNVTVWNLGAPLCGTACEAEMLTTVSQTYQLDEIVLAFYGGNDLQENAAWYTSTPANSPDDLKSKTKSWLRTHSRLATFLWVNSIRAWAAFRPPGIFSQADLNQYWPATERALRDLRQATTGKRLTILYLPSPPEWDAAVWQVMRSHYHTADNARFLVRDALAEWSRVEGVSFLDATSWLKDCHSQSDCVLPVDPHWTAKAHLLVAQGMLGQERWSVTTP